MNEVRLERGFKAGAKASDEGRSQGRGRIGGSMMRVSVKTKFIKAGEKGLTFGFKVNNGEIKRQVLLEKGDDSNIANSNGEERRVFG